MIKLIAAFALGVGTVQLVEGVQCFAEGFAEIRQRRQLSDEIKTRREILAAHSEFMNLFDRTQEERAIRLLEYRLERLEEES